MALLSSEADRMSLVATRRLTLLRDRLVNVEYAEALPWEVEDLEEIIHAKSSSWLNIIRWLLEQLSGDYISKDPDSIQHGIHQYLVGLGICKSSQAVNIISGKMFPEEQIKFLFVLISLVERKRNAEENIENIKEEVSGRSDQFVGRVQEVLGDTSDFRKSCSKAGTRKKSTSQLKSEPEKIRSLEYYAEENGMLQERAEKAKEKLEKLRKELRLKEGEVAQDYISRLKQEREDLSKKTVHLVESLKPLSQQVTKIFENELSSLMPINVADPIDLPEIDSLCEKVECIFKVQSTERKIENCATILKEKTLVESPRDNWSTRNTSTLPILQLSEDLMNAINS